MTPDNFLALEPLIIARLRAVLPACVAGDIQFAEFPNRAFGSESQ